MGYVNLPEAISSTTRKITGGRRCPLISSTVRYIPILPPSSTISRPALVQLLVLTHFCSTIASTNHPLNQNKYPNNITSKLRSTKHKIRKQLIHTGNLQDTNKYIARDYTNYSYNISINLKSIHFATHLRHFIEKLIP